MSVGDTPITVVGNLTDDPELRFTPAGVAMARFTVASTPRSYDKTTNQWKDGTALFLRVTAWREIATNAAETLTKGMRVVATGRLVQHNWQTPEGENRSMLGLDLDDIGPSLRFATATVTKAQRIQASSAGGPAADQWSASAPAPAGAGANAGGQWSGSGEEPPF
ncbi:MULTISPECIES: single-stranded DNA-binding protein [unclassified Kitasatospora]|uniref:single-stranded DNA-binding protein n=1 Tax=unclassified Kitasatospora TaxID=2633591 RepID=UPI00070F17D9|nr:MULTISPECIES: single-stranded DNA-binding protein [unclassified Kitasatospora]KQV05613.1 single-stranded DNA-binding protein [Kitasatospora sp. Root107]KRB62416.1 single-stranded DNA-binding protein [Kitasatospora sp. Root187]